MSSTVLAAPRTAGAPAASRRRAPLPVLAAATLAVVEALGLLALGLTSLDGLLGTVGRPSGALVATALLVLAGWVVLCAGGGASLVDGAGRLLLVVVSVAEVALLLTVGATGLLAGDGVLVVAVGPLGALPLPALALLGLAVPLTKLLLAGAPAASAWLAAGPAPVRTPAAPAGDRRVLRLVTVGLIGTALTAVALLGPAAPHTAPGAPAASTAP